MDRGKGLWIVLFSGIVGCTAGLFIEAGADWVRLCYVRVLACRPKGLQVLARKGL